MEFRPRDDELVPGTKWDAEKSAVGKLTVECDESSPFVRRLKPGERFTVLDLREKPSGGGTVVRVRTRHGWFTWGRPDEINDQKPGALPQHFRILVEMQRSDATREPPLKYDIPAR